jgi:hypothetical protein
MFQNLKKRIQVCLDVKGDQFQYRLWAGPVFHLSRYVYIKFQVVISITLFSIDNSLVPLATESPCIFHSSALLEFWLQDVVNRIIRLHILLV